ncbi:VOC family protein [Krasilnikovia sp. M28-CT-15]|uniref:VOC family protein n=1 Tax=Krasilnikovia sp. M28-CT-15 TaxID=3373540 RepID=UPI00399C5633
MAAGGRLVSDERAPAYWVLADPEGNKICLCTWQNRDDDEQLWRKVSICTRGSAVTDQGIRSRGEQDPFAEQIKSRLGRTSAV